MAFGDDDMLVLRSVRSFPSVYVYTPETVGRLALLAGVLMFDNDLHRVELSMRRASHSRCLHHT